MNRESESPPISADAGRGFFREYGRQVFLVWDAKAGYLAALVSAAALTASPAARNVFGGLGGPGITVSALGLTFVLASLSLLSAMLTPDLVYVLDQLAAARGRSHGLDGLIVAFRSTAGIAALCLGAWFAVGITFPGQFVGNGWETAEVFVGSLAAGLTVWLAAAIFQLVGTVTELVRANASLTRGKAEDEGVGKGRVA